MDLKDLTILVAQVDTLEQKFISLEAEAKGIKKVLSDLLEKEIPLKLQELGLKEATLEDGTKISVIPMYFARIKKTDTIEAYKWLRDNGFGDIIKRTIAIDFTKGEDEIASEVKLRLENDGYLINDQESVHYQTLNGLVREQIEKGYIIPRDLLGVYQKNEAKIKRSVT